MKPIKFEYLELAEKARKEQVERAETLRDMDKIISGLNNYRLNELLNFAKVLERAEKIELKTKLESAIELTDYGKLQLNNLKRELGET